MGNAAKGARVADSTRSHDQVAQAVDPPLSQSQARTNTETATRKRAEEVRFLPANLTE